jgi:hypothetical protein
MSAQNNEKVSKMREEVMSTRKEMLEAIDDAKDTLRKYQES